MRGDDDSPQTAATLTIREVAASSGLAPTTLRAWETRYGFPEPIRLPGGHRRYSHRDVERVRQVIRDRDAGLHLPVAIDRARRAPAERDASLFAGLRSRRPELVPQLLPKRAMIALSHAIEDESCAHAQRGLVFGGFQRERYYRESEHRWCELARTAGVAVVLADFDRRRDPIEAPIELPLARGGSMAREWSLICDAPGYRAFLSGWERPGQQSVAEGERLFETIWAVEPELVREGAWLAAEMVAPRAPDVAERVTEGLRAVPAPSTDDRLKAVTALTSRMIAYVAARELNRRPGRQPSAAA